MPRRSILTRKRLLLPALFGIALLASLWLARLKLARDALERALLAAGLTPSTFQIEAVGFHSSRISNLTIGSQPWLKASGIDVSYTLTDLFRARVESMKLTGVEWTLQIRDGALDYGYKPAGGGNAGPLNLNIPANLIELADAHIFIDANEKITDLALSARITPAGPDAIASSLQLTALDRTTSITAKLNSSGSQLTLDMTGLAGPSPSPTIAANIAPSPTSADWHAILIRDASTGAMDLTLNAALSAIAEQLGTIKLSSPTARLAAHAKLDQSGLSELTSTLATENLHINNITLSTLELKAAKLQGSQLNLDLAAAGQGWDLPQSHIIAQWQSATDASGTNQTTLNANLRTNQAAHINLDSAGISGSIESLIGAANFQLHGLTPQLLDAHLAIDRIALHVGDTNLTDGHAEVAMRSTDTVEIQSLHALVDDGSLIQVDPFTWNTSSTHIDTRITTTNLDLSHWIPIVSSNRATGEGRISGAAELALDWSSGSIKLGGVKGSLRADPTHGYIQVADADALGDLLEQQDPRFGTDPVMRPVRDRIISALRDFAFSKFTIELSRTRDRTIALTSISGFGRHGDDPQGINLTLDLQAEDAAINLASRIAAKSRMTKSAGKALDDFFQPQAGQENPK